MTRKAGSGDSRAAPVADGCRHRRHVPSVVLAAPRWRARRSWPPCARSPIKRSSRRKKEGRVESHAAYQADGFVAMAQAAAAGAGRGAKPKSNVKVIVVVDVAALRRGEVEPGETCEIRGVGPVPVSTVRELLGDAALAIVIKDGVAVQNVTHLKRRTTAHQRTVLEYWGIRCEVVGCDSIDFVDVHHVFEFARTSSHPHRRTAGVAANSITAKNTKAGNPKPTNSETADRGSHRKRTRTSAQCLTSFGTVTPRGPCDLPLAPDHVRHSDEALDIPQGITTVSRVILDN